MATKAACGCRSVEGTQGERRRRRRRKKKSESVKVPWCDECLCWAFQFQGHKLHFTPYEVYLGFWTTMWLWIGWQVIDQIYTPYIIHRCGELERRNSTALLFRAPAAGLVDIFMGLKMPDWIPSGLRSPGLRATQGTCTASCWPGPHPAPICIPGGADCHHCNCVHAEHALKPTSGASSLLLPSNLPAA